MNNKINIKPGLSIVSCSQCGFIAADLDEWEYPYSDHDYYESIDASAINPERPYIRHRINQIFKYVSKGRSVDLGCGLGETAIALGRAGFESHGVEESVNAINFLNQNYPEIYWHNESIMSFLHGSYDEFDIISLYHVLEHIPNPDSLCQLVASALRPNGLLVVEVPDVSGGKARLRGQTWEHWLSHHVNYFNSKTLNALLNPLGFSCVGMEYKFHLGFPQGIWWRDIIHGAMAQLGLHDIITTYWQKGS